MHLPLFGGNCLKRCRAAAVGLLLIMSLAGAATPAFSARRVEVDLGYVANMAKVRAETPYRQDSERVPEVFRRLDYDTHRAIRFRPERALWAGEDLPFRVEFFHPGYLFNDPVTVYEFTSTHEQEIRFISDWFDYGDREDLKRQTNPAMGYAGFRVRHRLNTPDYWDEFAVFLGGDYFRMVSKGQLYGLSARSLALNTGVAAGEEFPRFRTFWLGKPRSDDNSLQIFALLDSRSATGAYSFRITPGAPTTVDVEAAVYLRAPVERLGIAPFSSMYHFGKASLQTPADYRPQVHDSEGLLIEGAEGQVIWRPLVNPPGQRFSVFEAAVRPRGFGLQQRDRDFANYQDIEAAYHRRPSVWVEPGRWPRGALFLYEFGTEDETVDNVVSQWIVHEQPGPGEPLGFSYRISFPDTEIPSLAHVVGTRHGRQLNDPSLHEFVIDFTGEEGADVEAVPNVRGAVLVRTILQTNPYVRGWRVILLVRPGDPAVPAELDVRLFRGGRVVSEIWSHQWIR